MAETLSLVIAVDDKGTPVLKGFAGSVHSAADAMDKHGGAAAQTLTQRFSALTSGTSLLKTAMVGLGTAFAAIGVGKLVGEIVSTSAEMQGLRNAMTAASGSAEGGAKAMAFVREESNRLGLELTSAADAYKGLLAATVQAGKSSDEAQKIFTGVSEAATAMGLSTEDTKASLLAISQIMAKGKVSAEELRGQLGERFPPAMGVMAKALNVSTAELTKMLDEGKLTSAVLIPFAERLHKEFGPQAAANAEKGWPAAMNRLKNAFTEAADAIGASGLLEVATRVVQGIASAVTSLTESGVFAAIGTAIKDVASVIQDGLGTAMDWFKTTVIPLWTEAKEAVMTFAAAMVGPLLTAWDSLKSQAGESHGIVSSLMQAFTFLKDEVWPAVASAAATLGTAIVSALGDAFGWLYKAIGGLEGAWASVNVVFNAAIAGMLIGIEQLLGGIAAAAQFFGADGLANAIAGARQTVAGLRSTVEETMHAWINRQQDAMRGAVGLDKTVQDLGNNTQQAMGKAVTAAEKVPVAITPIALALDNAGTATVKTSKALEELNAKAQAAAKATADAFNNAWEPLKKTAGSVKELTQNFQSARDAADQLAAAMSQGFGSVAEMQAKATERTKEYTEDLKRQRDFEKSATDARTDAVKNMEAATDAFNKKMKESGGVVTLFSRQFESSFDGITTRLKELDTTMQQIAGDAGAFAIWNGTISNGTLAMSLGAFKMQEFGKEVAILEDRLFALSLQTWDVKRATDELARSMGLSKDAAKGLAQAYAILGTQSGVELEQMAVRAVAAFRLVEDSGAESATRLKEIFTNDVLPKITAAFGQIPAQFRDLLRFADDAVKQTQQQLTGTLNAAGQFSATLRTPATGGSGGSPTTTPMTTPAWSPGISATPGYNPKWYYGTPGLGAQKYLGLGGLLSAPTLPERRAAGAMHTSQGQTLIAGSGEMLLDRSTADALRSLAKGGGARSGITIQSPKFEVNMVGVDPRVLDGKAIVRSLLPALREELRRVNYDVEKL